MMSPIKQICAAQQHRWKRLFHKPCREDNRRMPESLKIMISSTRDDLTEYREAAMEFIVRLADDNKDRMQIEAVGMERKVQSGDSEQAIAISKVWVEKSDWMILIVGWWYGTVSDEPEAKGMSVTEFEYRRFMELKEQDSNRKVFVFVTGNEDTPEEYRVGQTDHKDLSKWMGKGSPEQRQIIEEFRNDISKPFITFFKNLEDFKEKLDKQLRASIEAQPLPIPRGALADLIVDLQNPIEDCISKVLLLGLYKSIHDALHDIRQEVIRRLREEIMPKWESEHNLSRELERQLGYRAQDLGKFQGQIKESMKSLGEDNIDLVRQLNLIVDLKLLGEDESAPPKFGDFSNRLSDFASNVQAAFTNANSHMQRQVTLLDDFHGKLIQRIDQRRIAHHLTNDQDNKLDHELRVIEAQKTRFLDVLDTHDHWQDQHDRLEVIDDFKGGDSFDRKLRQFCSNQTPILFEMIDKQIRLINSDETESDLKKFATRLREDLEDLKKDMSLDNYEQMRKDFDKTFYEIDKRTKAEVEEAQSCVKALQVLLKELGHKQDTASFGITH